MSVPIDRERLRELTREERERFAETHPRSRELFSRAQGSLLGGVPMGWMTWWAGAFPLFIAEARGARLTDVDGHDYVDFNLGEGAAFTGHSPAPVVDAVTAQARRGLSHMLPVEDAIWVGEELARRFGLSVWHFALSATDANRFALRLVRELTGRQTIVLFKGYYHGSIEDAPGDWNPGTRAETSSPATARVVEMDDLDRLESALAGGDVACVLMEPALTNVGIVLPDPELHPTIRELTRRAGALLMLDETHTFAAGYGGATRAWGLEPDLVTVGKAIGGGVPAGAYGFSAELAERLIARGLVYLDGVGGTMAANPLSIAAIRATLEHVLTEDAFATMAELAARATAGIDAIARRAGLPWSTSRLGGLAAWQFSPRPPRNAGESLAAMDDELSGWHRLHEINRGVLLMPFLGNVLRMSPATTTQDVDRFLAALSEAVETLLA